jgi:glutamate/tyrosine decarboxylase-like PLP-dependent enzyme
VSEHVSGNGSRAPEHRESPPISAWFAGPKAENGEWFGHVIQRILSDYYAWRRNYFPEDGVVVDAAARRAGEEFRDRFEDRLIELLGRLKGDVPFYSPRYAAHMISEQSLPSIAGYFATMLYNPNNVSADAAPVTVKLELEASRMIAAMLGHPEEGWAHLCSGGTVANLESLWIARSVKYLPLVVADARRELGLSSSACCCGDIRSLLAKGPAAALEMYARLHGDARTSLGNREGILPRVERALRGSCFHVAERGLGAVVGALNSRPLILVPESHHYCFEKAADVLGIGRESLQSVGVDRDFCMRVDHLRERLAAADAEGAHVLAVVGVVGTTEEGAVDPIDRILALRKERELSGQPSFWVHADAAYGGYLRALTVPLRLGLGRPTTTVRVGGRVQELALRLPERSACDALEQLGECDSIAIDPHKLGFVPYPAGCVSFRSSLVKPLVRQVAPYISDAPLDPEGERRSDAIGVYILEGSKPGAAAAAVWMSHGLVPLDTTAHGALVQETIRNAAELHGLLEQYPRLCSESGAALPLVRAVCLCPPGSNIVCFAFTPAQPSRRLSLREINDANEAVYQKFSVATGERVYDQSFFVSRTTIRPGQYSLEPVRDLLPRLGVTEQEYGADGVFLLRCVLMNPWYAAAKARGRYFLSELVERLFDVAAAEFGASERLARNSYALS